MSAQLTGADLLRVSVVLRACADQLAVLGHIMPDTYRSRPEAEMVVEGDIGVVMEQQRAAEHHLKTARGGQAEGADLSEAVQELHRSHRELNRTLEESPLSRDNLAKLQRDRQFVAQVIMDVLAELQKKGTFHSLQQAVEEEKKRKAHLQDIIIREEEGRLKTKALQRQLVDVQKEKTQELQRREESTAHLKDQLQELKERTSLKKKYVKSSAELLVYEGRKLYTQKENEMEDEIRLLQEKLDEETRVHTEMVSFLKDNQTSLGEKLEYWMERYEKDTEDKQQELNTLKINKTNNLAQLQDLAKKYRETEQVIIEDRLEKENLRKQLEKDQLERDAATKIQSWWRGSLVRKGLGAYKKSKKPKTKESKKGKGKGKKK
ncbi:dynein regulatory complex protein 9 [Colossoma macropomum]|uniref:dynein regulatory complex protein 9 n=1 Tax=Colossoma macropomum TaxID=42526 RepID=UPI001863ACF2|nr:dynein regulatory complex protein 9 [Colossoma macropomum]